MTVPQPNTKPMDECPHIIYSMKYLLLIRFYFFFHLVLLFTDKLLQVNGKRNIAFGMHVVMFIAEVTFAITFYYY